MTMPPILQVIEHSVVMGMGGLFDLRLEDAPQKDATTARAALDELADSLFELTR